MLLPSRHIDIKRMNRLVRCRSSASAKGQVLERDNRVIRRASRILESRMRKVGDPFVAASYAAEYFRLRLAQLPYEVFAVAWLDKRHRLIEFRELFTGTVDRAQVHLREVVRSALTCNATVAVFGHNHPSGFHGASDWDVEITELLIATLLPVDVQVIDHYVVTCGEPPFSMVRAGLIVPTGWFQIEHGRMAQGPLVAGRKRKVTAND